MKGRGVRCPQIAQIAQIAQIVRMTGIGVQEWCRVANCANSANCNDLVCTYAEMSENLVHLWAASTVITH